MNGLKKLSPRHREIARRLVLGDRADVIASEMGLSPQTISRLQQDPLFRSELLDFERELREKILGADVMQRLQSVAPRAAEVCISAMQGELDGQAVPLKERLGSAWDILDRTGFGKINRSVNVQLNPADLIIAAREQRNKAEEERDESKSGAS